MNSHDRVPDYQMRRIERRAAVAAKADRERRQRSKAITDLAATTNKLMGGLAVFAVFSVLTALSPDSRLLEPTASVTIPIANVGVPFAAFILIAPFILVSLALYMAFFVRQLGVILTDADARVWSEVPITIVTSGMPTARLLRNAAFYLIIPLALGIISYKALGIPRYGIPMLFVSVLATWCVSRAQLYARTREKLALDISAMGCCAIILVLLAGWHHKLRRPLDLEGANLQGLTLKALDLSDANLIRANLSNADLSGTTVDRADMTRANLVGADLSQLHAHETILANADLTDARLFGADFSFADLRATVMDVVDGDFCVNPTAETAPEHKHPKARFIGAEMADISLRGARLPCADFLLADLVRADMRLGDFSESTFTGASLQMADLRGSSFWEATFRGSDLLSSALWSANFFDSFMDFARVGGSSQTIQLGINDLQYLKDQLKSYRAQRYWVALAFAAIEKPGTQSWLNNISPGQTLDCEVSTIAECAAILPADRIAPGGPQILNSPWWNEKYMSIALALCKYPDNVIYGLYEKRMQGPGDAYGLLQAATATPCLKDKISMVEARARVSIPGAK